MKKAVHSLPRLWVPDLLAEGLAVALNAEQTHYAAHVLRLGAGDSLRLFNGIDGEWEAQIRTVARHAITLVAGRALRPQPPPPRPVHLVFCPLRKERMDFLIEKAVELGVTHLHPMVTERTVVRTLNDARVRRQIVEAAEQCERLDLPALSPLRKLPEVLDSLDAQGVRIFACLERSGSRRAQEVLPAVTGPCALLVGPEGGFTETEKGVILGKKELVALSLGPRILRAETAALCALSLAS